MGLNIWLGAAPAVAQTYAGTATTHVDGDTYIGTLTFDDSATAVVTLTVASMSTVTAVAAAFIALWNASIDPRVLNVIASAGTAGQVIFTSASAGRSFSLALTGGGTTPGAWTATGSVTPNSGPNAYGVAANWSLGAIPTTSDTVRKPAGSPPILYDLNQTSVEIGAFSTEDSDQGVIGRVEYGQLYSLRITPTSCNLRGAATLLAVDLGSAAIEVDVSHTAGSQANGRTPVNIRGTAITTVNVSRGNVGVANFIGHTATVTGGFNVSGGAALVIGPGVTVTGTTCVNQGAVSANASVPTVNNTGTWYQYAGTWTTMNGNGGTAFPMATGTYGTTVGANGFTLSCANDVRARTFTDATFYSGSAIADPTLSIIWTNPIFFPNGIKTVTMDFGPSIKWKPVTGP